MVSKKKSFLVGPVWSEHVFSPVYKDDPKMQTMQTVQTEYLTWFFFQFSCYKNSAQYVQMFVIYPQAAQTWHLTIDSIDKHV